MSRGVQTAIIVGAMLLLFGVFMHYQVTNNPNDPYAKCKSIFETNKVQCEAAIAMKQMRGY